jgi:hypothetical protein
VDRALRGCAGLPHDDPVTSALGISDPPPALRARRPGWRDPRLWIGVAILAASVLVGARVFAQADDLVAVWAVTQTHAEGDTLVEADLVAHRVRFAESDDAARYLLVSDPLPADLHLRRGLGAGELVPRSALGPAATSGLVTVPLGLPALAVPPAVRAGSHVDIWVTTDNDDGRPVARPLLRDVVVIAAPAATDGFGVGGDRQLVLGVTADQEESLGRVLAAVGDSTITVVGKD